MALLPRPLQLFYSIVLAVDLSIHAKPEAAQSIYVRIIPPKVPVYYMVVEEEIKSPSPTPTVVVYMQCHVNMRAQSRPAEQLKQAAAAE